MNLERINEIVDNYYELYDLAKAKIDVLEKIDDYYYTARGVEEISFDSDLVYVKCDDTCMGCYDSLSFTFPIIWLSKTNTELEELVIIDRNLRLEIARKAKELKISNEKKEKEKRDFEQYQKLKEKFEQNKKLKEKFDE